MTDQKNTPIGQDAEYTGAPGEKVKDVPDGIVAQSPLDKCHATHRCENHRLKAIVVPVCVPCLLESVDTLTQEVARLEGERDLAIDVAKSYGCHTYHPARQPPVDPSAQVQHLLDRVKAVERIVEDVTQTVIPAGEKKLADVDENCAGLIRREEDLAFVCSRLDRHWETIISIAKRVSDIEKDHACA